VIKCLNPWIPSKMLAQYAQYVCCGCCPLASDVMKRSLWQFFLSFLLSLLCAEAQPTSGPGPGGISRRWIAWRVFLTCPLYTVWLSPDWRCVYVLRQPVASQLSQVYLLQLNPARLRTLTLLIKVSATVTVYREHRQTLFLPGIISLFIMCIGY